MNKLAPIKSFLISLLSLPKFYRISSRVIPYLGICSLLLIGFGLFAGLFLAPPDYQQGDGFRIIYVHVPSAVWSLGVYTFLFVCSVCFLIFRIKLFDILACASAPIGAVFTFIALFTGALWGKPMWGTWWVWDARLTSELLLLFLYLGYSGLRAALSNSDRASRASALLAIIGMVDVPLIHFSVQWWHTLHQGPTLSKFAKPMMAFEMLYPLYILIVGFGVLYITLLLIRSKTEILRREKSKEWIKQYFKRSQFVEGSVNV